MPDKEELIKYFRQELHDYHGYYSGGGAIEALAENACIHFSIALQYENVLCIATEFIENERD